jgi:hypothetical protein
MPFHKLTLNFNAGELSPFLTSRTDVAKYESGCQLLENFIILPYGGVIRRPGTQWLGRAKFPDKRCRLVGFNFSVTTNFILEFGEKYIRFWTNGIQVAKPTSAVSAWVASHAYVVGDYVTNAGTMYYCTTAHTSTTTFDASKWNAQQVLERPTPYLEGDLREIQYCQINDLMYLVHPDYPPQKLQRLADDNWSFAELSFKWPPLQDENIQNITIAPSATSGAISLHASAPIWTADDVGGTWQIGHNMAGANQTWIEVPLVATSANAGPIRVRGPWSFTTYGSWSGEIRIIRTIFSTGVQETIRTYHNTVDGQRNVSTTGTEDQDCSLQLAFITGGTAGTSNPIARLEFANAKIYGLVKITQYLGPQDVQGAVVFGLVRAEATVYWSEGAFSKKWGYPRTVCLHDQRLIFGGSLKKPLTLHGSQIDDFENFQIGSAADQAFKFTISANESNPVQWITTQSKLLIGTAGDEWALGPQNTDQALGPGNVSARQQSSFGSAYLQARVVNEVVLFSQRQSKKIRELTFSFEKDGWVAPDLTILASHIADLGFAETAFAQQPDAIFWTITQGGILVGMTYERDQNVVGWHRHATDGSFESVATIYGGERADEVWLSVKRHVNGQDVRYIERFDPNFRPSFENEDKDHYWYLDCAFRSSGATEVTTVTGLSHLEGKMAGILGDGANQPMRQVVGGAITLQEPAKIVLAGLPYVSTVRPMNLNIANADTMQGRKIRIHKMVVRLFKSLTAKFSSDGDTWDEIFFRDRADPMDDSPPVFTGDKEVSTGATYSTQQAMSIRQDRPFPLCVLAEILWVNFYGE